MATQRLPDLLPRNAFVAGIPLHQSGLSINTVTMDELDRNTLILVSEKLPEGWHELTLAGCLKDAGDEIDQA